MGILIATGTLQICGKNLGTHHHKGQRNGYGQQSIDTDTYWDFTEPGPLGDRIYTVEEATGTI
jgi:hypothetical protein